VLEAGACLLILPSPLHTLTPSLQIQSKVGVARSVTQMKNQWETSLSIYKKLVPLLTADSENNENDRIFLGRSLEGIS
jgi:hypothetical protein